MKKDSGATPDWLWIIGFLLDKARATKSERRKAYYLNRILSIASVRGK